MNQGKQVCIIVDAYSTANKLAGVIGAYGYQCIHVKSKAYLPNVLTSTFRASDFIDHFVCDGSPDVVFHQVMKKNHQIRCVIAGAESGVVLADYLGG